MQDKRRFFSGATLEQAVARAARHYGVEPKELAYQEREKRHGFLHRRRGVVVEVNPTRLKTEGAAVAPAEDSKPAAPAPEPTVEGVNDQEKVAEDWNAPSTSAGTKATAGSLKSDELFTEEWWQGDQARSEEVGSSAGAPEMAAAPEKAKEVENLAESLAEPAKAATPERAPAPRAPQSPAVRAGTEEAARDGMFRLLALVGISLDTEIREGGDRLEVELSGNDQGVVLDDGGEILLALEHLLPRVIRGLTGAGVPCRIDADGFHATRETRLQELAERRASEVNRSRRRRTLPPMSPEERRIVHLALANRGDVQTESRGEGFFKRVTISPIHQS